MSVRFLLAAAVSLASASLVAADGPARPNVLLILADDLGSGDLGCYGGPTPTPHIDSLAKDGVKLTTFYSNGPECTPTRTALLTGRYQQRVGGLECALGVGNVGRYDDAIRLRKTHDLGLPADPPTLPKILKGAGYSTAIAGKWHLGYEPKFFPDRHGFDRWFGPLGGAVDYFHHTEPDGTPVLYEDGKKVARDGYMTDLITNEAVSVIAKVREPFFLYAAYTSPHAPIQGPNDRSDRPLTQEGFSQNANKPETYAAMIRRLDDGVGAILAALKDRGVADDTVVIFMSDNGGTRMARNAPFSGNKGQTYEGGIRVPCLVRRPGKIKAGTTSEQVGITMDLTVSLVRMAGASPPPDHPFDGIDLLNRLEEGAAPQPRTLFWRGRRGDSTWAAVRDGSLKWILHQQGDKRTEYLFDLAGDPAEKNSLLDSRPAHAERMRKLYAKWDADVRPTR
jgi:N-acetylgalactosamine-6-sulfatase